MKFYYKSCFIAISMALWLFPLRLLAATPLNIYVSILPQKYFVERIGRDRVHVNVLLKPGRSPATYSPAPDQVKRLAVSDIYFRIGVPFENGFLHKIESLTHAKIIDTRDGITLRQMGTHKQHDKNRHSYTGKDPHIWMNPRMVKIQAETILKTLSSIDPGNKNEYQKNYTLFIEDLERLDQYLAALLKDLKGRDLLVFHPSFGYFTDAYGLNQVAIETMGKAPKGKALSNIIKQARNQKIRVIFAQPQFDRNTAMKIASAIKGAVIFIDPLAYDYLANMKHMAQSIVKGLIK